MIMEILKKIALKIFVSNKREKFKSCKSHCTLHPQCIIMSIPYANPPPHAVLSNFYRLFTVYWFQAISLPLARVKINQ